jgi:predicted flap endonuclease-1-like 5' DNA nuclease
MEKELHVIQSQVTTSPANDLSINPEQSSRPVWILEAPDDKADDLQKIRGIGPVMERLLNEIGIYHYNQLARMNESDCLWIADRIKTFPKRIKRDRWQQQAVELDLDQLDQQELRVTSKAMVVDSTGDDE